MFQTLLKIKEKHKSKHNDDSDTEIRNHKSYHDEKPSKKHEHKSRNHSEERSSKKHKQTDSDSSKHKNHKSDKHDKDNVNKHKTDEKSKSSHEKKHSKHPKDHKHKEKNERKRKHDDDEPSSSKKKRYESDSDENSSHLYETSQNVKPPEEEEKPRSSKHKHHKSEKERSRNGHDDKKPKSTEKSKSKEPTKSSHGEEKGKRSEKRDKHSEKSKKSSKIKNVSDEDGIDCGSGASFAEALGMMEDVPTIRTTVTKKKAKPERADSPIPSTSSSAKSKPSTSKSTNSRDRSPSLLNSNLKLEPLDIHISSTLPEITTNYKPLPVNYSYEFDTPIRPISDMTEEEALDYVITSKTQRTKVYSGNKTWRYVPSLFNLCVKVLQEHIDALEYTGGVPYSILKPVLERATPGQLFNVENHNPDLIGDTDELWGLHCKKLFKGQRPQEMESWRDMYLRCCDEREAKLRSLTQNIKQSQEKSLPVRQTKLAYVDTFVKPPRAVARKQAKYGTAANNQPLVTPSSRLKDVAAPKSSNAVTVPNPAPQRASSSSGGMMKPKKAPLMQKALAAIKSRFRR